MNPKSMPRQQLLGNMDLDTREWNDGVLTDAARKVVKESSEVRCWVVCDGDVDPEWIESLNSVLDDNHLLTLPNGERISFGDNVNFLFETHDLRFASPATVSRMGMIFLSDEDVDVKMVVHRWLLTQPEDLRANLESWIDDIFFKALKYVLKMDQVVDTTMVGTVMNGLSQVAGVNSKESFVCGLIRGLGGNLSLQDRTIFAKEVFQWAGERPPDINAPLDCYFANGCFATYVTEKTSFNLEEVDTAVVPTITVQRTLDQMEPWLKNSEPFILVGPEGCGKNMMIRHAIRKHKGIGVTTLHCNAQTTAEHVITKIAQTCSLFSAPEGRVYRPRDCERLVLYLKDINLPKPDMYDTCMLIAFLQQLITFNGFYDENLEFLRLERVQLICSMNAATTVGRHPLSTRFTAVVRIGVVDYPDKDELVSVYDTFLAAVLEKSGADSRFERDSERERLARSMMDLYDQVKQKFSVDDHRHYLFTPRDLTAWSLSLLRYDLEAEELLDVFAYEAARLFRDRLVDADSEKRFDSMLGSEMQSKWKHKANFAETYFTTLGKGMRSKGGEEKGGESPIGGDPRLERIEADDFRSVMSQGKMFYEREERDLNMLLFPEILDHIVRIDRVLSRRGGHLLLVGSSGVGRRTATMLTTFLHGYSFQTPQVTRHYSLQNFYGDLKTAMQIAGVEGEGVVLYVEDHHIVSESILETVNSLLSAGEVPGLYTHEELEPLLGPLKELMMEEGTHRTPYEFFVSRVKKHLHVVLGMDSDHPKFVVRCESNPALYTCCSILWFGEWRRVSMRALPKMLEDVKDLIDGDVDSDEEKGETKGGGSMDPEDIVEAIVNMHLSCKSRGATPREFVSFLRTWYALYASKKLVIKTEISHLGGGLSKLESAAETVDKLQQDAAVQQKELQAAQVAADRAMEEITNALAEATERKKEVEDLKEDLAKSENETLARKEGIEEELASIVPVLESAKKAVGSIKNEHLTEIKSLAMPPEQIADVLSAVLKLLGIQDCSWLSMKRFLGNRGVKDQILNYDARSITPKLRKEVQKIMKQKAASFEEANIKRVSVAAAPLAAWSKAQIRYSMVLEKINPLEQELEEAKSTLVKAKQRLEQCESELKEIDDRVAQMKVEFGEHTRKAETLRAQLETAQDTLDKAQHLLGQLSGEQTRWSEQSKALQFDLNTLPKQMLLAAGFQTYLVKAPESVREEVVSSWCELTGLKGFSFKKLMSTESQLLIWKSKGLPADDLSQENALVIANSDNNSVPFVIDPANAATAWLKSFLGEDKQSPLETVTSQDPRFTSTVELAVRFGKTLLILDIDGLEPILYPLARKDLMKEGARLAVQVGDKQLDFNENFRMVLVTRNPNPDLPPDAAALVTEVNFTVTKSGLEGQLLGVTIQHEQPELEKEKSEMLQQEEEYKVQLAGLEKDLLQALATAEGNLLENTALIESLTKTKEASAEIQKSLEASAKASEELEAQSNVYRPFAKDGSTIFFLIQQLAAVNPMYQFSLASFIELFKLTLGDETIEASGVEERLEKLTPALEKRVLYFVGRALFKADRAMFALHLLHGVHPDQFKEKEWELFTGTLVGGITEGTPRDFPPWASSDRAAAFSILQEHFPQLLNNLELSNMNKWQRWASSMECERDFPSIRGLSAFQRVLVVQALRPDRLQSAIIQFCQEVLDVTSLSPPPQSFDTIYEKELANTLPMLIITTTGADPSQEIEEFAGRVVGKDRYQGLAMGGGQQEIAMTLLRSAAGNGDWLCLQNLHLVVAWLPTLEKEINQLNPHKEFRLFLTSEAHHKFPPILLQQSLKMTFESPPGIKKNMQRTYSTWSPDFIGKGKPLRAQLLFVLAWFHAIMQERRNYIPQGWTKFYEFSSGDFRAGTMSMDNASEGGEIDWETIHGLMEDAIYGGRVDNPYDLRVLKTYLKKYFNSRMIGASDAEIAPGISVPNTADHGDYMKVISQLGDSDQPMIFGLPDNIERSLQRTTSEAVIALLRQLSAASAEGAKFDREVWRAQLGPIIEMWEKITESSPNIKEKGKTVENFAELDPVSAFVLMEDSSASDLCAFVHASLMSIKRVIYGSGMLTPAIQATATSLLSGTVPATWEKKWEGPETPQVWLRAVVQKKIALSRWVQLVHREELLNTDLSLDELFNAGTFLNALRQQTARLSNCAMDSLKMVSCWDAARLKSAPLPLTITGLTLQGASFAESSGLHEAAPNAPEVTEVSSVTIAYLKSDDEDPYTPDEALSVPLYYSLSREKMLVEISMPYNDEEEKWILSGTALFLGTT
mmetsp:Transcript_8125/g.10764  ORF Transcript_8125/g.10764 Transcript_8125/m.10764 type:complete len:2280 (+) Transcript_8125:2-6841(+)